ncbi:lipocalin-1 interacting membrane receptor, putative [Ixodes scapularis]|uniref:Lipocalin-1 interacting membrane receptor, putative n=1 Tax=Ixodes scapularis TaxID=6945 RepID=B7PV13_IXOSC|nr:lipocalin-1 interacting membrane receptor, putative [Ixodes scapularis]|eukprot:XP_002407121.1 lipocalin-1 interacting membrane receptor, putative [Ixodes scapularis]
MAADVSRHCCSAALADAIASHTTGISLLMVVHNTLELLVGIKALPASPQVRQFSLGISSLSALGIFGSALEVVLILYPLPPEGLLCHQGDLLALFHTSLGLAVLQRKRIAAGITNFDLLGDFGRIEWLASFPLVLAYNVVFAVAAATSLATKMTAAMRRELLGRLAAWGKDD